MTVELRNLGDAELCREISAYIDYALSDRNLAIFHWNDERNHLRPLGVSATLTASSVYSGLAVSVFCLHALFILWVIFGAFLTRSRPLLRWLHIVSLVWGILTELLLWPCPLTTLENWLETKAGVEPYQGGFLLHYLDKLVYPDVSATLLTIVGVLVCALNLAFYGRQIWIARRGSSF